MIFQTSKISCTVFIYETILETELGKIELFNGIDEIWVGEAKIP